MERIYNFGLILDWKLISAISTIDRFDASWASLEKTEGANLKQLRQIATVRSVGASTRIEGSKMSDEEVDTLLQNIDLTKLEDRDAQEVAGYFNVLDLIVDASESIAISENSLKNLHNQLLKHSEKDQWHKGNYKQHSNSVEAVMPDGSKQLVFETTPAGVETEDAMRNLIDQYRKDHTTHPLVQCALFAYEFVSIHPFQDGNGRLSRLLSTLLLLKNGYSWIQYVSFEHEIENRRSEYYRQLRMAQAQRPNENVSEWVHFFFRVLIRIQTRLLEKLEVSGVSSGMSPKQRSILTFISGHSGTSSGEIANRLAIPNPTVKRILKDLVDKNLIAKYGAGRGTSYSAAG